MNKEENPTEVEETKNQKETNEIKKEREAILKKTSREYFHAGEDELNKGRYNSAVVLFFKALTSFSDLFLLKNIGKVPSSHTDRFRITQERFSEIYEILDKNFPFYQESYNSILTKELAEKMKDDAKTMARKIETEL